MNKFILLGISALVVFFVFKGVGNSAMPTETLTVYNQDEYGSFGSTVGGRCESKHCLTVYVAPWCPVCKQLQPMILALSKELKAEGVDVKIIIGNDSLKNIKKYANNYPFPVLLDPDGTFYKKAQQKGVPFFLVSNQKGMITKSIAGGFPQVSTMRSKLNL